MEVQGPVRKGLQFRRLDVWLNANRQTKGICFDAGWSLMPSSLQCPFHRPSPLRPFEVLYLLFHTILRAKLFHTKKGMPISTGWLTSIWRRRILPVRWEGASSLGTAETRLTGCCPDF